LTENNFSSDDSAEDVFEEIKRREQIFFEIDPYEAQKLLLLKGVSMPISISKMKFRAVINKESFLSFYGLPSDISAKEAFGEIRNRREYKIPEDISDEDAYKILILKHAIKEKGYLKYEPIKIADNIKKETAVYINEIGMELPGVNIEIQPIRHYPYSELGAHVLGYMGKIATESEISKYVNENGYERNSLIGKVGIEGVYELDLKGEDGHKYVEVDALGKFVREVTNEYDGINSKETIAGKNIKLTIDIDFQKKVNDALVKGIKTMQEGGVYESPWGDFQYKEPLPKAETGAAVVVDVKTGRILAITSYPSYDINLFSTGISNEDWDSLKPKNSKNMLAPRPLYNIATLLAAQPGSTYKMITGFAAIEQGLDPYKKLFSDGFITIGNHRFGCWYYNDYGLRHGYTDMVRALAVSCNYYFYNVSVGYDYYLDRSLNYEMNAEKLIEYSKLFGLNEKTGIEIYEANRGVPDPEKKKRNLKSALRAKILYVMDDYFPEEIVSDEDRREEIISEILSWADEEISRGTLIKRLIDLGADDNYYVTEGLADVIKYDYFNLMNWYEGDTFNMAIGQGGHEYTPVQIARYISTIANGGYLNELTLVDSVGDEKIVKNQNVTNEKLKDSKAMKVLKEGMYAVTSTKEGGAYSTFKDFPIKVAGKTGSAERMGKIPPEDEIEYFKNNLSKIDPELDFDEVVEYSKVILERRNLEIEDMRTRIKNSNDEMEKNKLENKISDLVVNGYLSDEALIRSAIKELSSKELTDIDINYFRDDYDSHAWFVSFAPYEDPEIAVVVLIPQGGHGSFVAPIAREIYAQYFNLYDNIDNEDN
jgi:penicillin-binding protein 2